MSIDPSEIISPTSAQLRWHDMELGMFFHFDIPIYDQSWDWRSFRDFPDPDLFQPVDLDTDQWMEAAKAFGAKYAVFVAKHCSGFLQWQSDLYPYGVKQSSWRDGKGDIVDDFITSCRKYGIEPGLYASVSANGYLGVDSPGLVNGGKGGDDAAQEAYVRTCEKMAGELWSRYGDLFEIWFDGGAIPVAEGGPDLIPILEANQPDAIVFQGPPGTRNMIRWVGNERGIAPYPCWSTADSGTSEGGEEEKSYQGDPNGGIWTPGECDVPIRNHDWFWEPDHEDRLYSVSELMEMYYASVGRNCNLLLNANPGPNGLVPDADLLRYEEFGREIRRRFSESINSISGEGDSLEFEFESATNIDHVVIMEDISFGERVLEYSVRGLVHGDLWKELCSGSCIGHKRIHQFDTVEVKAIRLDVLSSKATPHVRDLSVYHVSGT